MSRRLLIAAALAALTLGAAAATSAFDVPVAAAKDKAKKSQWGDGIPFTTDYEAAISEAVATGKMLLIYNGWEKTNI